MRGLRTLHISRAGKKLVSRLFQQFIELPIEAPAKFRLRIHQIPHLVRIGLIVV
jgi:hypothetical protein